MLACHSPDQFKSSAVHWDLAELPAARKGLQFILRSYFIISSSGQDKQELQSKTSIWLVMKTLLMCWCWVWQYESQP